MSVSPLVGQSVHMTFCSKASYRNDYMKIRCGYSWSLAWVLMILVTPWSFMQHCQLISPRPAVRPTTSCHTNEWPDFHAFAVNIHCPENINPIVLDGTLPLSFPPVSIIRPNCSPVLDKYQNLMDKLAWNMMSMFMLNMITLPNFIDLMAFPLASSEQTLHF